MSGGSSKPKANPRDAACAIVARLQDAGHVAYFAGGCVRDELMGLTPTDYDVATGARPEEVKALFHSARFVGEAFGVSLVRQDGQTVEVATFRTEGVYADGRRPTAVTYTDAEHDAQRRDFTMNGLFCDPLTNSGSGEIIDYVGGQDDIRAGVLRAIGDPAARFAEDYLRMLRAVRFAARFDLQWDDATRQAVVDSAPRLGRISRERIGMELQAMVQRGGDIAARAVSCSAELGLDQPMLNVATSVRDLPVVAALGGVALPADGRALVIALAVWLMDRELAQRAGPTSAESRAWAEAIARTDWSPAVRQTRHALALDNERTRLLRSVFNRLPDALCLNDLALAAQKRLLGAADWPAIKVTVRAIFRAIQAGADDERLRTVESDLRAAGDLLPEPLLSGDDLIAAGMKPGPVFKRVLEVVYDAQLEGKVQDKAEAAALAEQVEPET